MLTYRVFEFFASFTRDWLGFTGNAYIMVKPKNTTVKEGSSVELDCQAEGYPNNITYRWFKNNIDVQSMPELMSRGSVYSGQCRRGTTGTL